MVDMEGPYREVSDGRYGGPLTVRYLLVDMEGPLP